MSRSDQIPLPFDPRPALGAVDFLVAPCNADAVAWMDRWPDWPAPLLVLVGPKASGKTHLTRVFLEKTGGRLVLAQEIGRTDPLAGGAWVLDDAERVLEAGSVAEEALFHLINGTRETSGSLLLTADEAPARWDVRLADLRSRLNAAQVVEIGAADDTLLLQLMTKQFADRQIRVEPAVTQYLLTHMERSFEGVTRMVDALDAEALAQKRAVTVPLARAVLARLYPDE